MAVGAADRAGSRRMGSEKRNDLVNVVDDAHDADDGRRINAFTQGLVIQADVAAGDGSAERVASCGEAVDSRVGETAP